MSTIPYEQTKANDTGFVPGTTWPWIVTGLILALGLGTYLALGDDTVSALRGTLN